MDFGYNLFPGISPLFLIAAILWSSFWKLLALWRAVKSEQRYWFVAIFILNTFGILEIIYLLHFSKKKITLEDFKNFNFLPKS